MYEALFYLFFFPKHIGKKSTIKINIMYFIALSRKISNFNQW